MPQFFVLWFPLYPPGAVVVLTAAHVHVCTVYEGTVPGLLVVPE